MEYHGKLYGKIGDKYFDTGKTSDDYDTLKQRHDEALELLELTSLELESGGKKHWEINTMIKEFIKKFKP